MISNWLGVVFVGVIVIALFRRCFTRRVERLRLRATRRRKSSRKVVSKSGLRPKKAAWVRHCVLELQERHGLSHRKLADLFNQLHLAETGVSVGRTWVCELLIEEAHAALHRQRELKHHLPVRIPNNCLWGIDTTSQEKQAA